jgi:hypothetical protein
MKKREIIDKKNCECYTSQVGFARKYLCTMPKLNKGGLRKICYIRF